MLPTACSVYPKVQPMANSPKKLFDVAHPGKSLADSSSRPVIVSNRPVMQDPMMTNRSMVDKNMTSRSAIDIKPLHENVVPDFDIPNETESPKLPAPVPSNEITADNQIEKLTEEKAYFVHIKGVKRRKMLRRICLLILGIVIMAVVGYYGVLFLVG